MNKPKKDNRKRKVDKIWENIFEKEPVFSEIERKGYFQISSSKINSYEGAEARLLTKFDYWASLPYIFQKNKLNILPVKRGEYVISHFNAYHTLDIDTDIKPKKISFPYWIKTLNYKNLSSEAKVLNCAFVSGIIDDVVEEEVVPTIDGRMSSDTWDFYINNSIGNKKIKIRNDRSQCQIDGGYEGLDKFALIEAKNSVSNTFVVRQLYYPLRLWHKKIGKQKMILPVFLVYSSGVFHFLIYEFTNIKEYNSLKLVTQKSYVIKEKSIRISDINKIMSEIEFIEEPEIPFPQANTFERVVDLLEAINENPLTVEKISLKYDFNYRQGQYYSRAGMYLGLLKNENGIIKMTKTGKDIMNKRKRERYLLITKKILQHKVFWETLKKYLEAGIPPSAEYIYQNIMLKNKKILYKRGRGHLGKATLKRRASTVKSWINWILSLLDIV